MDVEGSSSPRRPWEAGDTSLSMARKRTRYWQPLPEISSENESEEEPNYGDELDESHGQDHGENPNNSEEEEEEQSESRHEVSDESDSNDEEAVEDQLDDQQSQQGEGGGDNESPERRWWMDHDADTDEGLPRATVRQASASLAPASSLSSEKSVIGDVTVENTSALDCGICYLPLKPPIFQCDVGHVVCSPCRDKLATAVRCHVCRAPITGGYRRCHAMEQLVDSIRVPCPHAAHGCAAKPAYHDREDHTRLCVHAPCRCPGEACGFVASTAALLDHFGVAHGWPCTTETSAGSPFFLRLRDGFNIITPARETASSQQCTTARHLFVLNVARMPFGRAVSAFCLHPHPAATAELKLTYSRFNSGSCNGHCQLSTFQLACADISSGLPDPNDCFQLIVPRTVLGDDEETINVIALIGAVTPLSTRSSTSSLG